MRKAIEAALLDVDALLGTKGPRLRLTAGRDYLFDLLVKSYDDKFKQFEDMLPAVVGDEDIEELDDEQTAPVAQDDGQEEEMTFEDVTEELPVPEPEAVASPPPELEPQEPPAPAPQASPPAPAPQASPPRPPPRT